MRILVLIAALAVALAAAGAAQGGSPRVGVFYYPWYSTVQHDGAVTHWDQNGHVPPEGIGAGFYPARGVYSSADKAVIAAQMAEIDSAGAGIVISSWWGRGSLEDLRLPAIVTAAQARGLAVAVQIEPYPGRSAETVAADVAALRPLGISDFYVYRAEDTPAAEWAAVVPGLGAARLIAHTMLVGWAASARFAGIYTYDVLIHDGTKFARLCAQAHALGLRCEPSVGPGFDAVAATGEPRVKDRRNGRTYDHMWRLAIASGADVITVTSYNEWHEGSQIEPAARARRAGNRTYQDYEGAWGLSGAAAATAYLARTRYWADRFDTAARARSAAAYARILATWPEPISRGGKRTSRTR